ncbi:MAG: response regulator [Arcobacteraceae bacterium]|nr:response regulator [Arcobacteraceae bacterium]
MGSLEKLKNVAADKTILYIESDKVLQKNFGIYLQKIFKKFYQAYDGEEGFELFLKIKPNIVLMDLKLDKKDAIELIADIKDIDEEVIILTLSASDENYNLLQSLDMGLAGMLLKPVTFSQLVEKLIRILPPVKKVISQKVEKQKIAATPIVPKSKEVAKKQIEKKVETKTTVDLKNSKNSKVQEPIKQKTIEKTQIVEKEKQPLKEKLTVAPKEAVKKEIKTEPKLEIKVPKTCMEDVKEYAKNEESILLINTYKGITIHNQGELLNCEENSFEVKASTAQIVAAKYEKHVILKVEMKNKYIFANIINIDLKNNKLRLVKPYYISYQQRDKSVLRLTADSSFKATMFFNNTHIDFKAKQLSSQYVLLTTDTLELNIKPNMQLDLTFGFDISSPSVLIKEKKFTKTFAKGTVIRVDKTSSGIQIAMAIEVQKSGQSNFSKYLKQRENETIEELKQIMKR